MSSKKSSEYLICKRRGHEEDYDADSVKKGDTYAHTCKWCGTLFWTEEVLHEENIPLEYKK